MATQRIRRECLLPLLAVIALSALAQEKLQPKFTVDLKPLGAAPDLFTDQSDSATQQRAVINTFWLGNDHASP